MCTTMAGFLYGLMGDPYSHLCAAVASTLLTVLSPQTLSFLNSMLFHSFIIPAPVFTLLGYQIQSAQLNLNYRKTIIVYSMQYLGCGYTKNFTPYLKFKFNCSAHILSGNPTAVHL